MFKSIACATLFAAVALAQNAAITYPTNDITVSPGQNITVQVTRANSLTGSEEVAVVIGFQSCPDYACASPADIMGLILYNGGFDPEYRQPTSPQVQPYQNFTVQIPTSARSGAAQIGVTHVSLVGAGPFPFMETMNQTITVA